MVIFQQRVGRLAGVWSSLLFQLIEDFLYGVKCGLISFYPLRLGVYETQNRFLPLHGFLQTATNQLFLPKFQIRCIVLPLRFFLFQVYPQRSKRLSLKMVIRKSETWANSVFQGLSVLLIWPIFPKLGWEKYDPKSTHKFLLWKQKNCTVFTCYIWGNS